MSLSKASDYKGAILAVLLSPIIIPLAVAVLLYWLVSSMAVVLAAALIWRTRGISYLIVYSDSAQWKGYFEVEVIPAFGRRARVLNLSRDGGRKKWWHLDWWIYRHCAGYRNRFPIMLRFSLLGRWKTVRFYEAFLDAKKSKNQALEEAKALVGMWRPKTPCP